jgi:DNA-binding NtrC family response regulator
MYMNFTSFRFPTSPVPSFARTKDEYMQSAQILLVDQDRIVAESMAEFLRREKFQVQTASTFEEAQTHLEATDLVIADVNLPVRDGFELLQNVRETHCDIPVILITSYGTIENAVEAIRLGAFDYMTKPIMSDELKLAIDRALGQRRLTVENRNLKQQLDERFGIDNIVGHDYRMLQVYDVIESVADSRTTVLMTGESGTGKTMTARAIHRRSARRDAPFVEVACGALPETLLESELFGHKSGSFTGAVRDKIGKFAQADGGTIFLDEIATASPALQVKLLRVLQDMEFEQVGGTETVRVDARVILATNQDLAELVAERQFRQDLYYRINVVSIHLPALRERISDIPLLSKHFVEKYAAQCSRRVLGFTEQAMELMQHYPWHGNIRELENVVERAIVLGKGEWIQVSDLPAPLQRPGQEQLGAGQKGHLKSALQDPERRLILEALEAHSWNRQETADALGINRTTLYKKMKRYGIGAEDENTPLRVVKWS